jgi:hypothetical protein
MLRNTIFASLLASSALTLAFATPVSAAGTSDRAREAIAAAEAKIHTAETLGAGTHAPRDTAEAQAALATAREDFKSGRKEPAIREAIRASALADTAIGMAQQHKDDAIASAREDQRATADAAQDQVAAAHDQAASAQDQAVAAQQQAAEANARAESAQNSAAASAADAAAARNAAAMTAAQTPPTPKVETTVTTQRTGATHRTTRTKVVQRPVTTGTTSEQVTTTTKVTPQ